MCESKSYESKETRPADLITNQLEGLKASVRVPPEEEMTVTLVKVDSLDRLEEYRSVQNIIFLLIGLFGGSTLSILVNWTTNEAFIITRFSLVLIALFFVLTIICALFAFCLHQRINSVLNRMLHKNPSQ